MQEQSNGLLSSLSNDQSSQLLEVEDFIDDSQMSFFEDSESINQSFSQYLPPIGIEKIQDIKMPKIIDQYCKQYHNINPFRHFKIPPSKTVPKSVCSKIIHACERIIECADCGMDESCVICIDCFKDGNHEGHKYVVKRAAGGCCDCGDVEAWKEEGFCKKHSGTFEDFQIEQSSFKKFHEITDGLFYYYFHCRITESPSSNSFAKSLISFLSQLNQSDLYYNKLTTMALNRKLPQPYNLNQTLNNRTILENILTFKISGNLFERWWEFFMTLFSYYPFKLDLLTIYAQKYSLLMDGNKQCKNICSMISCQLLTSYKLIEQYCQSNTRPLASLSDIPTETGKIWQFYIMILYDLKMINKLAGKAPLAYWKIQVDFGFDNILNYQQIIWKKIEKYSSSIDSTLIMSKFVHFCQLEKKFLEIYADMLKIIQPNSPLLKKIIVYFYGKCAHAPETRLVLLTLRVYERCLALALFKYFSSDLTKITQQSIQQLLEMLPNVNKSDFEQVCSRIVHDIEQTYFLWSKCMAETGFGQTLYNFIYFYRSQSPFIMYTDIICLKIFYLFMGTHRFINFKKIIEYDLFQKVPQQIPELYEEQLSKKRGFYSSVLQQVTYLSSTQVPEIYLAYCINSSDSLLYSQQISDILHIIFRFNKNRVSYKDYKNFQQGIFHKKNLAVETWIKHNTTFNKAKKQFQRKKQGQGQQRNINTLNRVNTSGIQLNPLKLSLQVQESNKKIFAQIFCKETIESLIETLMKLYSKEALRTSGNTILNQLFLLYDTALLLQIKDFNQLNQLILAPNQDLLHSSKVKPYGIETSSPIKNSIQQQQKIKAIKSKKLQKMKSKQQQFIKNRGGSQFDSKLEQNMLEEESCCICKNQNPQQFVYLVKVQQRNHERLMKRGEGLECLTFMSCYHIFDQKCINSKFNCTKLINSISCPLCKTSANIIMPFSINNKAILNNFIKRMTMFTSVITNSKNVYQQLFKSFYHYIMLASIDLNNCLQKRAKVYRLLYQIIKVSITQPSLISLHNKFTQQKLNRKYERGFDQKSERFFSQMVKDTERSSERIFKLITKPQNLDKDCQQRNNIPEKQVKSSQLLCSIMDWLFAQLGIQGISQDNNCPQFFKIALKYISQKGPEQIVQSEFPQLQKTDRLLVQLPHKYTQIGNIKKCSQCEQMSSELYICLLCGWVGCQSCHKGSLSSHINKQHGQLGALMNISNSLAIYCINTKTVQAGWLYQNQWQQRITIQKDWNQFQLSVDLLNTIQRNLKLDEIPTKNRHC